MRLGWFPEDRRSRRGSASSPAEVRASSLRLHPSGLDTLITGEAPHHAYHQAMEMGINLILGGHYATETFGVKALGDRIVREFGVEHRFLEYPTGF